MKPNMKFLFIRPEVCPLLIGSPNSASYRFHLPMDILAFGYVILLPGAPFVSTEAPNSVPLYYLLQFFLNPLYPHANIPRTPNCGAEISYGKTVPD